MRRARDRLSFLFWRKEAGRRRRRIRHRVNRSAKRADKTGEMRERIKKAKEKNRLLRFQ
jgi:5-methylcytosine-specific restriction endonuclease McrA